MQLAGEEFQEVYIFLCQLNLFSNLNLTSYKYIKQFQVTVRFFNRKIQHDTRIMILFSKKFLFVHLFFPGGAKLGGGPIFKSGRTPLAESFLSLGRFS